MRISMESDLVSSIPNFGQLFWEGLDGMSRHEPGRFDPKFIPEFEQAVDAYCGPENSAGDVGWVCWRSGSCVDPGIGIRYEIWG